MKASVPWHVLLSRACRGPWESSKIQCCVHHALCMISNWERLVVIVELVVMQSPRTKFLRPSSQSLHRACLFTWFDWIFHFVWFSLRWTARTCFSFFVSLVFHQISKSNLSWICLMNAINYIFITPLIKNAFKLHPRLDRHKGDFGLCTRCRISLYAISTSIIRKL